MLIVEHENVPIGFSLPFSIWLENNNKKLLRGVRAQVYPYFRGLPNSARPVRRWRLWPATVYGWMTFSLWTAHRSASLNLCYVFSFLMVSVVQYQGSSLPIWLVGWICTSRSVCMPLRDMCQATSNLEGSCFWCGISLCTKSRSF